MTWHFNTIITTLINNLELVVVILSKKTPLKINYPIFNLTFKNKALTQCGILMQYIK